jgi:post-segregation antitoxin (ccd killing protein)
VRVPQGKLRVWHDRGMSRIRISTTVDSDLLEAARERRPAANDSSLLEEALAALLRELERAEISASYREAYDRLPLDTPDEWGDLASFRAAAGAS